MNDAIENNASLRNDVECILLECHRDRPGIFASSVTRELLVALAGNVAQRLGPMIGGRYVPKRDERAVRNAAVRAAFTGANHAALMKKFTISRRLVYSILAQKRSNAT